MVGALIRSQHLLTLTGLLQRLKFELFPYADRVRDVDARDLDLIDYFKV
jgi:hypothetical protein